GTYTVTASYLGYVKTRTTNVKVLADLTTTTNFNLKSTALSLEQEVVVVAQAPLVKKDLTSTESRVTADEIEEMPLQDLGQLISLQAGVNRDAQGDIHIRGGRSSEVSYLINGISITDDYNRSQALTVETSSIQELQVISGTFNAEYGNALSGVVNLVTKIGTSNFQSNLEIWTGDYVSGNTEIFWNVDKINPISNYNLQGSVSGPLLEDVTYFFTARRINDGGYIYGINRYSPQGLFKVVGTDTLPNPGDGSYVSMNSYDRWSGQGTINWKASEDFNFKLDAFGSLGSNKVYNHLYRFNPNGVSGNKSKGFSLFGTLTHFIFLNTFQEFTAAYKYNDFSSKLYDDPYDQRYAHPDLLNVPGYRFYNGGTDLNRFERNTKSLILKWDLTSQIDKINLAKIGIEFQSDKLFYENINLVAKVGENGQQVVPFEPYIQGIESPQHDLFERNPFKLSAYVQDKIEFESLIINVGLRFDLFNPRGKIPVDKEDPNIFNPFKLEHIYHDINGDGLIGLDEQFEANKLTLAEKETFWYRQTTVKTGLSPRFGVAYPITDKGIIRFSFGIFQQIPEYSQLYLGDQFKLTSAQGLQGATNEFGTQLPFGNNDLEPQTTSIYEIGLQQQISEELAFDLTAFYRDIRNWVSSSPPIPTFLAGISYSQRINRDFANVKGITLAVNKRFSNYFSFGVDYTYQIAEGINSTSDEQFFAQLDGSEPKRTLTPLDWDQTHTLNLNVFAGTKDWGVSLISSLRTGQPFTPTRIEGATTGTNVLTGLADNSRRRPSIVNIDMELFKNFDFTVFDVQLFLKVFNLLDLKNPVTVFGDTGKPDYTLQQETVSDYDESWFVYPTFYSPPRSIFLGTKISIKN
ncbi:MAG: TonB-dependent receptor plug domain-containing protein, partial [Ignavibacteriaceae bacterium]|nr:TonB-dependent receptor plug domain-containing protein [Ignavibacteriaceae bacterium]